MSTFCLLFLHLTVLLRISIKLFPCDKIGNGHTYVLPCLHAFVWDCFGGVKTSYSKRNTLMDCVKISRQFSYILILSKKEILHQHSFFFLEISKYSTQMLYLFGYKAVFSFQNNQKNSEPSDLELSDC